MVRPQLNCFGCLKSLTWKCSIFYFNFSIQSSPCLWTIHIDWGTTGGHLQIFSWYNKYFSFYKMLVCFCAASSWAGVFSVSERTDWKEFSSWEIVTIKSWNWIFILNCFSYLCRDLTFQSSKLNQQQQSYLQISHFWHNINEVFFRLQLKRKYSRNVTFSMQC